jgi:hypothetical protein
MRERGATTPGPHSADHAMTSFDTTESNEPVHTGSLKAGSIGSLYLAMPAAEALVRSPLFGTSIDTWQTGAERRSIPWSSTGSTRGGFEAFRL